MKKLSISILFFCILVFAITSTAQIYKPVIIPNPLHVDIVSTGTTTVNRIYLTPLSGYLDDLLSNLPGTGTVTSVTSANSNLTVSGPTGTVVITLAAVPYNIISSLPTTLVGYGIVDSQPLNNVLTQVGTLSGAGCEGKVIKQVGGVMGCQVDATGGVPAFSVVTSGTAASKAFVIGDSSSLGPTGTGTITATAMPWAGLSGTSPTINGVLISTSPTLTSGQVGAVPTTRTVNTHALSADVVIGPSDIAQDSTHRWTTDTEKATWNGFSVAVAGDLLTYSTPTITLLPTVVQKRLTASAADGFAIKGINEDGSIDQVAVGGNVDFSQIASGTMTGETYTVSGGGKITVDGGEIDATKLLCTGATCTYNVTFAGDSLSSDRTVTVPNRSLTLDNITTDSTSDIASDSLLGSDGANIVAITLGDNLTLTDGVLASTGGEGTYTVTTSTQDTDTTLTAGNFGSTGINPLRIGDYRYKLPSAAANLYRPLTSRGTATIWPASPSDVITLNGTALTASNQVQCTKGPLWVTGFGTNDWSIDGANCTDGGQPTLTSSPTPTLAFGSVSSATTSTVGFTNTGSALATLGTPTLSGTDKARFTLNNACSSTLATSASCNIGVLFDATVGGPYAASLDFPFYNTTKSVAITGTGTSSGDPAPSGDIYAESFEGSGSGGYVLAWSSFGSGTKDPAYALSNLSSTGSARNGSYGLRIAATGSATHAYYHGSSVASAYREFSFYIASTTIANTEFVHIASLASDFGATANILARITITNQSGVLKIGSFARTVATGQWYYVRLNIVGDASTVCTMTVGTTYGGHEVAWDDNFTCGDISANPSYWSLGVETNRTMDIIFGYDSADADGNF